MVDVFLEGLQHFDYTFDSSFGFEVVLVVVKAFDLVVVEAFDLLVGGGRALFIGIILGYGGEVVSRS